MERSNFDNIQKIQIKSSMTSSLCQSIAQQLGPNTSNPSFPMSPEQQNLLIETYLNEQVFYHRGFLGSEEGDKISEKGQIQTENPPNQNLEGPIRCQSPETPKKSIFHNFQKHLITIIKKYINIPKKKILAYQEGGLALDLWHSFIKTNSFNKRLLHTVFGVQGGRSPAESLADLASTFKEFSAVHCNHSWERLMKAQAHIRTCIVEQASQLSKSFMKSNSNITKFQEFYGYYCSFILEIEAGPMSKRMTKISKETLIKNMKQKGLN